MRVVLRTLSWAEQDTPLGESHYDRVRSIGQGVMVICEGREGDLSPYSKA
jgi:hypothetical protein